MLKQIADEQAAEARAIAEHEAAERREAEKQALLEAKA